jgi:streptomycin 6-kinase
VGGYLVAVRMVDGSEAVLKLSPTGGGQDEVNALEAYALRRWGGEGAVKVFEADARVGALLIERCVPGVSLDTLPDEQMLIAGCEVARRLHRAADGDDERLLGNAVTNVAERVARLDEAMEAMGHPLSARAERVITRFHEELSAAGSTLVVCHGDMNPGNLLAAERMDWLAVDPLPVRAPAAYDAASLVWSKRPWVLAAPDPAALLRRRVRLAAAALGAEAREVRGWTLVRLTGILISRYAWGGYDEAPFIRIGELLCQHDDD